MLGQNLPLKEVVHDAAWLTEPFLGVKGLGTYGDIHIDTLVTSIRHDSGKAKGAMEALAQVANHWGMLEEWVGAPLSPAGR